MDTYRTPFPQQILDNLSLLLDMCTVEYPVPHDKKKVNEMMTQINTMCRLNIYSKLVEVTSEDHFLIITDKLLTCW